jgi:hypothetical protein
MAPEVLTPERVLEATEDVLPPARCWDATCRFHDPVYAPEWAGPQIYTAYTAVRALVLAGLAGPEGG